MSGDAAAILWTQVGSLITLLAVLLGLYRVLVQRVVDAKDATIELLNARIGSLERDLAEARAAGPDALVVAMTARKQAYEDELRALQADAAANRVQIQQREEAVAKLEDELEQLKEIADEYLCSDCGAVMTTREFGTIYDGDREAEAEHVVFACGREWGTYHDVPCPTKPLPATGAGS